MCLAKRKSSRTSLRTNPMLHCISCFPRLRKYLSASYLLAERFTGRCLHFNLQSVTQQSRVSLLFSSQFYLSLNWVCERDFNASQIWNLILKENPFTTRSRVFDLLKFLLDSTMTLNFVAEIN